MNFHEEVLKLDVFTFCYGFVVQGYQHKGKLSIGTSVKLTYYKNDIINVRVQRQHPTPAMVKLHRVRYVD